MTALQTKNLAAQTSEVIRAGRPGQATIPYSVGKLVFQHEMGFSVSGFNEDKLYAFGFVPATTFRLGLTEQLEINAGLEFHQDNYHHSISSKPVRGEFVDSAVSIGGLSLFSVGTRINIFESQNYIPSLGMQIGLKLPFVSSDYQIDHIAPQIILSIGQKISDQLALTVNLGMDWTGVDAEPLGLYIVALSYSPFPKWTFFAEGYGNFKSNLFEHRWDVGAAFMVNNHLQLDLFGGLGDNHQRFDYFFSAGLAWRIARKK